MYLVVLQTVPTHTEDPNTPTQRQTMNNGDLFRLGETNCVQVWDCVWWNTERNSFIWQQQQQQRITSTLKSETDSFGWNRKWPRKKHKCFIESGSASTEHIQEVLTDASEEWSLW